MRGQVNTESEERITEEVLIPLSESGWSDHYNLGILNDVIQTIKSGSVQVWANELLNICPKGSKCLEIGCGTGISSLWLAKNEREVSALDYTESSVELVKVAAESLCLNNLDVIRHDATEELPFADRQFDYIFQAGLLEHFKKDDQIELLRKWSRCGKKMISMIPNAASIPYRVGKDIMEKNGTWRYGLEIPSHSFKEEFTKAGIYVEKEYTIGTDWAESFLPEGHYVSEFFSKLKEDGYDLDSFMQGYLLVTIGDCD